MMMAKVDARVGLDAAIWERIDAAGQISGLSRDQIIDGAVRRALGGQALMALFTRVRERSDLSDEEATALIAAEKAESRAEQDTSGTDATRHIRCA
jgi:hypothetical protein